MAFDPKSLTVDFTSLSKVPTQVRQNAYAQGLIPEEFLSQLTPTQLANLFPKYFSKGLPDVSGFRSATGGAAPTTSPTGTATEAPAGVSAPAPVSRPSGTSQPTVASQNQQAQQAEQAQQGLAGILSPYMPQQAATSTSGPSKRYSTTFTPREQAVLSFISKREGSKDPNIVFGGNRYKARLGLDKVPLTERTISDVINNVMPNLRRLSKADGYGKTNSGKIVGTSAVGTGQMIEGTLKGNLKHLGIPESDWDKIKFTEELQQRLTLANFETSGIGNPNADPSTWSKRQLANQYESLNPRRGKSPMSASEMANIRAASPERVTTPTAEEFQEKIAQPASKNVFKLDKEKLREAAKKSNLLAGLASDEKIDSEINKKIQSLLPEGASYNPQTGEITGNMSIDDIKSIVKEKAPEFGDQISEYIQPVGQPLVPSAQDEQAAQAEAVPTVAMSDDVKTFISELPEQARNELSKDPKLVAGIDAAIKAGAGEAIKGQIIQQYTQKEKPTATEITDIIETEKRFEDKGGSIRNLPIPTAIKEKMLYAQEKSGIARVVSVSSGQMSWEEAKSKGARKVGKKWVMPDGTVVGTGSVRHGVDVGAADLQFYDEKGNKLRYNHPQVQEYMKYAAAAGLKGQGAGRNYMGDYTVHIGAGTPASWGGADDIIDAQLAAGNKIGAEDYLKWREQKITEANQQQNAKDVIAKEEQEAKEVLKTGAKNLPASHPLAIKKVSSNQQVQAQTQTQPTSTNTAENVIPQAGGTATQAQATATEAPPKEEKGVIQKAWDWVTGSDNSSEAPLAYGADMIARPGSELRISDGKGREHVVGEAGAEKVSVESKYDPQEQNKKMETYQQQSQSKLSLPESMSPVDFEKTSTGAYDTPTSMRDAINYSKFAQGGFSRHLYLNGSKNVV